MINSNGILINRRIINMIIQPSLFHVINCEIFWNIALFRCSIKLVDAMFFLYCQRLTCLLDLYRESKFLTVYCQYAQTSSYLHQILLIFYQTHYHQIMRNFCVNQIQYHILNIILIYP